MHFSKRAIWGLYFAILSSFPAKAQSAAAGAPEVLTFDELVTLSETDPPAAPLEEKLDRLLTTPFLNTDASAMGAGPRRPIVDGIGPVLRVANWNIERGLNFDLIKLALSDPEGFKQAAEEQGALDAGKLVKI